MFVICYNKGLDSHIKSAIDDDVEGDDADDNDDVHVATVVTEASPLTR